VRAAQSGLLTHIATTESVSLCADEKLTAFVELGIGNSELNIPNVRFYHFVTVSRPAAPIIMSRIL
jgi:hypothetical protein